MGTKADKAQPPRTAAARRRLEQATVEGAYNPGPDRVLRIVDTLRQLHGSGRIDETQRQAGDRYIRAHEIVSSGPLQCALGRDSTSQAPGPRVPMPTALHAADDLGQGT